MHAQQAAHWQAVQQHASAQLLQEQVQARLQRAPPPKQSSPAASTSKAETKSEGPTLERKEPAKEDKTTPPRRIVKLKAMPKSSLKKAPKRLSKRSPDRGLIQSPKRLPRRKVRSKSRSRSRRSKGRHRRRPSYSCPRKTSIRRSRSRHVSPQSTGKHKDKEDAKKKDKGTGRKSSCLDKLETEAAQEAARRKQAQAKALQAQVQELFAELS